MTEHTKKPFDRRVLVVAAFLVVVVGGGIAGATYLSVSAKTVSIDKAQIEAPEVDLAPVAPGTLQVFFVTPGQVVPPNTVVAQVGVELIKSTAGGLVLSTNGDVGNLVPAGQTVVAMIDPSQLKVVGGVDENKGLSRIKVGDPVSFTVDAFGGQQFTGVVDEVSPTSNQSGVVFNISSQREIQQFDVKARFDTAKYPQLKNGMSARMSVWVE